MKKFYFTFGVGLDKPHRNCYYEKLKGGHNNG